MFKYNNTHIFTGYLKQFLSTFNLPACKIYTKEFEKYLEQYGEEDPRVLESFDTINANRLAVRINYLKNNELYNYFWDSTTGVKKWKRCTEAFYTSEKPVHGLTRSLNSKSKYYDMATHEYLGDYLRFLRDYYNVNLMSMYNCFNDKIYNNVSFSFTLSDGKTATFDTQAPNYKIYAVPVKLFSEYTIAIDCSQGIELFCGLYNTSLDITDKAKKLAAKTYLKVNKTLFSQPFLYTKLNSNSWSTVNDCAVTMQKPTISPNLTRLKPAITPGISLNNGLRPNHIRNDVFTRWDIINKEKDLRLFIKVPTSCKSSITILEGDYRGYNDAIYTPVQKKQLQYSCNHSVLNFNTNKTADKVDLNNYAFKPISKLQLLAFNTGESYPFADRLVEYLIGSAITPIDDISDNIKRAQKVMEANKYYFKIDGLWEDKMQNIIYDYMINSGPIKVVTVCDDKYDELYGKEVDTKDYSGPIRQVVKDKRQGTHPRLGHTNKSTLYDILGYVDKDAEKWYASWKNENNRAVIKDNIQNVDIYDGRYDLD